MIFWGYYNWLRTGHLYLSPIASGIMSGRWSQLAPKQSIMFGLRGLLLSKGGNIFAYSPILLLSMFGWKVFFKERKKECIFILSIIILFLLANSKIPKWYGLWCWGPRHTLEITPLMMLPMGYWFSANGIQNKFKKSFFIIISIYSLLIQLGATLTNWHSRLGYVLYNKGRHALLFTVQYSQWWDSVRTLFINLWNLVFGSFLYLNNPGYCPTISEANLYASKRLFTWWYRLVFMGVSPLLIASYVILSIVAMYILTRCIMRNELFKLKTEAGKW